MDAFTPVFFQATSKQSPLFNQSNNESLSRRLLLLTTQYVHLGAPCSHSNRQIRFHGPVCQHSSTGFSLHLSPFSHISSLVVLISLSPSYCCAFLFSLPHIILNRLLHSRHLVQDISNISV